MSQIEALRQGKSGKCLQLQQREEHRVVQHVQLKHYQGKDTQSYPVDIISKSEFQACFHICL